MKSTLLLASISAAAIVASGGALASGEARSHRVERHAPRHGSALAMQVVPTTARAGEPGNGWRYFSDTEAHRAVVISPQGEYFYSRGKGLRPVVATQPGS